MITNADCTIYSRIRNGSADDTWLRQYVPECWWFEDVKSSITSNGLKTATVLTVRIPDTSITVKVGDYIVKGNCSVEMQTVKDLSTEKYYAVTGANYNRFGMNPHVKVMGT